uniref:Serpentine Receptor, class Z n=1 Tax=Panagrellus redivivus TaxID=6233 RepID=A0A7E4ZZ26_PANRE
MALKTVKMEELPTFVTLPPTTVLIYSIIYYAITVINILVTPIYMYAVIFKSKDSMKSFKKLLIAGMPFLIYSTFSISLTIPIYAVETYVFQWHGLINNVPRAVNVGLTTFALICDQQNSDLMLIMLIIRYQIISRDFVKPSKFLYPSIYGFIAFTNIFQTILLVIRLILPPFISSVETSIIANANFFIASTGFILTSRIYAFIKVFLINRSFARKIQPIISPSTLQMHTMLFRAVLSNVLVTVVSKLPYLTVIIGFLIDQSVMEVMVNVISISHNLTYICEMIITLYFVRPYRDFVRNIFRTNVEVPVELFQSSTLQVQ